MANKNHDWMPAFWGTEYQTYRCTKCGSGKRVKGNEIGYCFGCPTLFTKWDEPKPTCSEKINPAPEVLKDEDS